MATVYDLQKLIRTVKFRIMLWVVFFIDKLAKLHVRCLSVNSRFRSLFASIIPCMQFVFLFGYGVTWLVVK